MMAKIEGWGEVSVGAAMATAGLLLLAFLTLIRTTTRPRQRLPPGPRGWPIFGSLFSLGTQPHVALFELSKRYGPIMFMRLGSMGTVVVSSPKMAEEVLKTHDQITCSRPDSIVAKILMCGGIDMVFAPYGQAWRYVRKVCTVGLLTQTRIHQFQGSREREVLACLHFILEESQRGNAVDIGECFGTVAKNTMTQMVMKKSFSSFQPLDSVAKTTSFGDAYKEAIVLAGAFNLADFIPVLKPFDLQGFQKRTEDVHERLDKFFEEIIEEHRQSLSIATPENHEEDFVHALLRENGQSGGLQENLSMASVKSLLLDMLAAAADSSSSSSVWVFTELMRHPNVMKKLQEELDSVVGPNRLVQEEDLPELKYLHAVVKETLRLHPAGPLLVPHFTTHDCEIQGFHIPARTRVVVNAWGIHRDPVAWERPSEFDPERFLNSEIEFRGQDFQFLPFGSGRRMCPGMNWGWLMMLYPIAVLVHSLEWSFPEEQNGEDIDVSETFGLVLYKRLPLHAFGKARLAKHAIYPADPDANVKHSEVMS